MSGLDTPLTPLRFLERAADSMSRWFGVPDEIWGERPKALVVAAGADDRTGPVLIAHVRSLIAHFKAPRDIEFVVGLPKTSTGKIRKNELRDQEGVNTMHRIRG